MPLRSTTLLAGILAGVSGVGVVTVVIPNLLQRKTTDSPVRWPQHFPARRSYLARAVPTGVRRDGQTARWLGGLLGLVVALAWAAATPRSHAPVDGAPHTLPRQLALIWWWITVGGRGIVLVGLGVFLGDVTATAWSRAVRWLAAVAKLPATASVGTRLRAVQRCGYSAVSIATAGLTLWLRALAEHARELPAVFYWGVQRSTWRGDGGYYAVRSGRDLATSGSIRLGLLRPANLFERLYPVQVWIPADGPHNICRHFALAGITGAGKTTTLGMSLPTYAAIAGQSVFLNDVKVPGEYFPWFVNHWRRYGRHAVYFSPFTPDETLAMEPLYAATAAELELIVDTLMTVGEAASGGTTDASGGFFTKAGRQLLMGLCILMRYLPRRYCNFPTLYRIVAMGANAVIEAITWVNTSYPSLEETKAAARRAILTPERMLEKEWEDADGTARRRPPDLDSVLTLLDRSGAEILERIRAARVAVWGSPGTPAGTLTDMHHPEVELALADIEGLYQDRRQLWERTIMTKGTLFQQPDQTFANLVLTAQNYIAFFDQPEIAAAFSRPECSFRDVVRSPTLFVVGAPLSKGPAARFILQCASKLVINAIFTRTAPTFEVVAFMEEMPAWKDKDLAETLALIRSKRCSINAIFQTDNQIKQAYGQDYGTVLDNFAHQLVVYGAQGETAERAAKRLGQATIRRKQQTKNFGTQGGGTVNYVEEKHDRIPASDVTNLVVNGRPSTDTAALSIGALVPPFLLDLMPYWRDPVIVDELRCRPNHRGQLVPEENHHPYHRVPPYRTRPEHRPDGTITHVPVLDPDGIPIPDPHATDPLRDTIECLAPPLRPVYYQLADPAFIPKEIGISPLTPTQLQEMLDRKMGATGSGAAKASAGTPPASAAAGSLRDRPLEHVAVWHSYVAELLQSDGACPVHATAQPLVSYTHERRYGWRELASLVGAARREGYHCTPRLPDGTPAISAVELPVYLLQTFHAAADYPSWLLYWLTHPRVGAPTPERARAITTDVLGAIDLLFGGIPATEWLWDVVSTTDSQGPAYLVSATERYLEHCRDRLAGAVAEEHLARAWADLRAGVFDLVPLALTEEEGWRLTLVELAIDYAAHARAAHLDLVRMTDREIFPDSSLTALFTASEPLLPMPNRIALLTEMQAQPALTSAVSVASARLAGLTRLATARTSFALNGRVAALIQGGGQVCR